MDSNDLLYPEGPGDEALPLVSLDRTQRAMALSQLSLQSLASDDYEVADAEDDDVTVGMATAFNWKTILKNIRQYSKNFENF